MIQLLRNIMKRRKVELGISRTFDKPIAKIRTVVGLERYKKRLSDRATLKAVMEVCA